MTKNSRAIFYLRTPAPSDDHAVLWYLPTCPEMRGLRTPPQTLLTLPRRSFFFPISTIPLTPPARPRSRASLAQSFFTCVWTTATLKERTCALRSPVHVPMSIWYDGKTSCQSATKFYEITIVLAFHVQIGLPHPGPAPGDTSATSVDLEYIGPTPRSPTARIVSCQAQHLKLLQAAPLYSPLCRTPTPMLRLR